MCACSISKKCRNVFGRVKTGFHCYKQSFRAEEDGAYECVPSSNLFCDLYQYILNREINAAKRCNVVIF